MLSIMSAWERPQRSTQTLTFVGAEITEVALEQWEGLERNEKG